MQLKKYLGINKKTKQIVTSANDINVLKNRITEIAEKDKKYSSYGIIKLIKWEYIEEFFPYVTI